MSKAISLPFSFDVDGRITSTKDLKKIIQDRVVLVVMTLFNERVMRPNFGTYVKGVTFESINNTLPMIKQEVEQGFSNWLPYLQVLDVSGTTDSEGLLNVTISYKFGSSSTPEVVTVKTTTLTQSGTIITEALHG